MKFFIFSLAVLVIAQVAMAATLTEKSKDIKGQSKQKFWPGFGLGRFGYGYGGLYNPYRYGLGYGGYGLYGGYGFLKGKKNHGKAAGAHHVRD